MTRFEWSDEYSVGIRMLDNDHRGLFEVMNDLQVAVERRHGDADIGQMITYLVRYVQAHFGREERLMREYGYPHLADHKNYHRKLTREVFAVQKLYETDHNLVDVKKLIEFLRGWLIRHILGTDMDYAPYLRGSKPAAAVKPQIGCVASDTTEVEQAMETVQVTVPVGKAVVVERCATILTAGGVEAEALEECASPIAAMTLDEAKTIAGFVLP